MDLPIYHVLNKSIAGYQIFNNEEEFCRFKELMIYYFLDDSGVSYSKYLEQPKEIKTGILNTNKKNQVLVNIIAYCLMPTHFHMILEEKSEAGISKFTNRVLSGYSHYFNNVHQRRGPLW
ncbi:MAG: transposase [Candidatus Omnitrophica bacterium]|nr:transposase [Candidatus Omnitrophota bacterium]